MLPGFMFSAMLISSYIYVRDSALFLFYRHTM
jgi:hypothetical protein